MFCGTKSFVSVVRRPICRTMLPIGCRKASTRLLPSHHVPEQQTTPYVAEPANGLSRPVRVTHRHRITLSPSTDASLTVRLFVHNYGVMPKDLFEIHTVTGARPARGPPESLPP